MAKSPSHRFGQVIGTLLEEVMRPRLQDFCAPRDLYLDVPGKRPGVRRGKKIRWTDRHGNKHDLDFVIERGGSFEEQGRPVAFIEAAWRRYTKHSRNKAQEIQGAILPIAERHGWDKPFLGAILASEFDPVRNVGTFQKYEAIVKYSNGDRIDGSFVDKKGLKRFLSYVGG